MKNIIIFLILFYKLTVCSAYYGHPEKWMHIIESQEIIVNNQLTSIKTIFEENSEITDEKLFITTYPNIMYTALKCKYANVVVDVLQFFYEIILHYLTAANECDPSLPKQNKINNWIKTIMNHFNNTKRHFVKMISILFYFSDEIHHLRSSDQSLLKSLLSINLFLYYNLKESPYIDNNIKKKETETTSYNKTIESFHTFITSKKNTKLYTKMIENVRTLVTSLVHMVGLVEHFRYKNCMVRNPFETILEIKDTLRNHPKYDTSIINDLWKSKLKVLNELNDIHTENNNNFNDKMYDPEYLLFQYILTKTHWNFIAEVTIRDHNKVAILKNNETKSENKLKDFYTRASQSKSIEKVLQFQNILFAVIANIFYYQLYEVLANTSPDNVNINKIDDLLSTFRMFVSEIVPNNCLTNICNEIITARNELDETLQNFHSLNDYQHIVSAKSNIQKRIQNNYLFWNKKTQIIAVKKLQTLKFVQKLLNNYQFKSFNQVAKLLSYESYTNSDYKILDVNDLMKINEVPTTEKEMEVSNKMLDTRYLLFAFRKLLIHRDLMEIFTASDFRAGITTTVDVLPQKFKNNVIGPMFIYTLRCIVKYYEELGYEQLTNFQDILVPLLIKFRYIKNHFHELSKVEYVIMEHNLLVTICLIENKLLRMYPKPIYNLVVYTSFFNSNKSTDIHALQKEFMENSTSDQLVSFDVVKQVLESVYYKYVNEYNLTIDDNVELYWNGEKCFRSKVLQNVTQGVIDFYDLIKFYWTPIKWYIGKTLIEMQCISDYNFKPEESTNARTYIINTLNTLMKLQFPKSILPAVSEMFKSIILSLNTTANSNNNYRNTVNQLPIKKYLEALGIISNRTNTIKTLHVSDELHSNIQDIKIILMMINKNETKFSIFLNESSSMVLLPVEPIAHTN